MKTFTKAIISTSAMTDASVILDCFCRLIPSIETRQDHVTKKHLFPLAGSPTPDKVQELQYESKHGKNLNARRAAEHYLNAFDDDYQALEATPHLCLFDASFVNVKWIHALKQNNHGVILYDTEGSVEGILSNSDEYRFYTFENGVLRNRGIFSAAQRKWLEEIKPITSWRFRPKA